MVIVYMEVGAIVACDVDAVAGPRELVVSIVDPGAADDYAIDLVLAISGDLGDHEQFATMNETSARGVRPFSCVVAVVADVAYPYHVVAGLQLVAVASWQWAASEALAVVR